ncbi:MAG: ribonuclease HI [Bacteroidales bacterium]|nr:ribonuclease HI [Bacteroidales bacterium]
MSHKITIYTDGAARGNPGPGGYGIVMRQGDYRRTFSAGYRLTTNNRMELLAVIVALEKLRIPESSATIYTDSRYVSDAIEKGWLFDWERKGFKKKKNPDMWRRFLKVYRKHNVKFVWVKGHSSIPENELCDKLAVDASYENNLEEDNGYTENDQQELF